VNFDDLHNSIATDEPSLNNFPLPGRGGGVFGSTTNEGRSFGGTQPNGGQNGVQPSSAAQISRSGSLVRRPSNSTRQTGPASIAVAMATSAESMGPPATQPNIRSRRQSHYPPSTLNNANRTPRKSIGPGILTSTVGEPTTPRRRPSVTGKKNSLDQQRPEESTLAVRLNNRNAEQARVDGSSFLSTTRSAKAKSLQPPSREPRGHLGTPIRTPDHSRSSSTNAARTPGRSAQGTNTPSSKRMSVMPAHATGLGARTISPTDARRLKRLSTMQAPPMPYTPPTPQPEIHYTRPRSTVQSPSMIPRKSVTPSSNRTTPDPNRKSYSSGLSLSSNTSYNSFRNSNGSMQPKLPQGLSSSRLPTPKPRLENLGGNNEEEVPPVPAIPKAYESPRNEADQPFFSVRKSSLGYDANFANLSAQSTPTTNLADPWNELGGTEAVKSRETTPYEPESKPKPVPNIGKKNLQPLRLPPLNLLPLSTPTASRIAALNDFSSDPDQRAETPPRQVSTKTPSTPMTASKATFSRTLRDEEPGAVTQMRSSSTHFALRSDSSSYRAPSSSSTNIPSLDSLTGPRTMSPFLSSSLPKTSAEFNYVRPKFSGEYNRANFGTGRLTGPRAQTASQTLKDEPLSELSSPTEPETPQSGTSLRHKFSLTRKRSLVKDKNAEKVNSGPDPPKYDNMPPPKLPASATWSNLAQHNTSPVPKPSYLKSRRKTSAGSVGPNRSAAEATYDEGDRSEITDRENTMNRAASMFAPMQKMLGPKSPGRTRSGDSNLDRDDLLAEDEMKKLGAKRKDFEAAARELDELYRRATPKDGVSPSQALRMVSLNIFERGEIEDYNEIYFCGTQSAKKRVGDLKAEGANFGYDDERGDYQIVDGDHLAYRYEVVDVLGKGSFGQVVRCVDHKTGGLVAVKIIRNKKRFHQQALVEVNILQKLKEWVSGQSVVLYELLLIESRTRK
jgi:dual specificity tyrosine-phosphorylation-regulated kinase 2/3/4